MKDFKPSGVDYALAVRLTGKFKTAFPGRQAAGQEGREDGDDKKADEKKPVDSLKETKGDNTVMLVGDADMLYDPFTLRRINSRSARLQMPMNANLNFAQNLVEQLTGDNNLIAVRSRATLNRPFTRVKEMEAEANEKFQSEIKELEDSAAEAQRRSTSCRRRRRTNQRFILSPSSARKWTTCARKRRRPASTSSRCRRICAKRWSRSRPGSSGSTSWPCRWRWRRPGILIAVVKRRKTSAK